MDVAEGVAFLLQVIEHMNEIVLAAAAENRQLMLIKADFIYMRQLTDGGKIFFCQSACQGFCLVSLIIRCGVISLFLISFLSSSVVPSARFLP